MGDYLWDRTGWAEPDVLRLERVLGPMRFVPSPGVVVRRGRASSFVVLAAAAAVVAGMVAIPRWPGVGPAASLEVTRLEGTPTISAQPVVDRRALSVGGWLETDPAARASIDIAGQGRVEVSPDTRIGLLRTRPGDYRLRLSRGTMQAVIWAPPGQFSVATPSSTAVDLGCVYSMTVDDDGIGVIDVTVGWVGFEWRGRESFIPAGAMCLTRPRLGPGTPYYQDTSDAFRSAVDSLDLGASSAADRSAALSRVLTEARPRDTLTLWHLLSRVGDRDRDRVFDRLAAFVPPPAGATREAIRAGRRDALDAWWDALDLGTAIWWRTWKQQWRDSSVGR